MTPALNSVSHKVVANYAFKHGLALNWLGGFPEGCVSWSLFQNEQHTVSVFEDWARPWLQLVFFSDIVPVTGLVVTDAYGYIRGNDERPSKVVRRPDRIETVAEGTTLFETQPWAFVDACIERHTVEILKGDYASTPVGDSDYVKGRRNTPEHYYCGDGVEVRLHDVTTAPPERVYWLKVHFGSQVLRARKVVWPSPHGRSELHVIEGLERWEQAVSVGELEEV